MNEHDIFLSYARRNNAAGWVTEFRKALENALMEKPDVQNVSIFMDEKDISGGEAYDKRILNSLTKSAVLVIIVSEASLDREREWCHRERQEFLKHIGGQENSDGRIYLVNYDGIDPARLPEEVRRFTAYSFYERDRTTDDIRPGALIDQHAGRFHSELYNLRRDLIQSFHDFAAPSIRKRAKAEPAKVNVAPVDDSRPKVFLCEALPGKVERDQYAQIESALRQRVSVVPGRRSFFAGQSGFENEIDNYLKQSSLFVQLLSTECWPESPTFPQGYERWLYDRAKSLDLPIIRWRSGDMDIRSVEDPAIRDFLNLDEPKICDLSEFIPLMFDELQKQQTRQKFKTEDDASPVLLMADLCDEDLCDEVGTKIEEMGSKNNGVQLEPEVVLVSENEKSDVVADAESLSPSGLVVVWDRGPEERLQRLLKQCRRYRQSCEINPPECAIVVPSEQIHNVGRRPPRFQVIGSQDQEELREYVGRLNGVGA